MRPLDRRCALRCLTPRERPLRPLRLLRLARLRSTASAVYFHCLLEPRAASSESNGHEAATLPSQRDENSDRNLAMGQRSAPGPPGSHGGSLDGQKRSQSLREQEKAKGAQDAWRPKCDAAPARLQSASRHKSSKRARRMRIEPATLGLRDLRAASCPINSRQRRLRGSLRNRADEVTIAARETTGPAR